MEAAGNWICLPNEILEIIFSYCTHSDLVQSIQNVCCRWREVAQSSRVWEDVTYCPDRSTRPKQVVEMLKISPKLQNIILQGNYDDRVLLAITDNCVELRKVEVSEFPGIDLFFIKNLQEECPKLEYLKFPHPVLTDFNKFEAAGKFANLKVLHLTGRAEVIFSMILKPVADYCKKLEHVVLENHKFKVNDLRYLLTMRKDTLHTLGVSCCDESGECVLPALSACELKSLSLFRYGFCWRHEKVEHFGRLKTVKALSIISTAIIPVFSMGDDLRQIFDNGNMAQLLELSLENIPSFHNEVVEVIVRNCPLLKHLSLSLNCMSDASLQIILNLVELNSLTISRTFCVTDTGILHLQGVKCLKRLTISRCKVGLQNIAKLSTLEALTLEWQDLAEFPWDLIPHHMKYLQCLRFRCCKNVDTCAVKKLKKQLPYLKVLNISEYCASEVDPLINLLQPVSSYLPSEWHV